MSDTVTTLSLITLAQEYRGDTVRQINRRTVFLKFVRIVPGEGKNVAWAPEGDGAVVENFAEGADATNFGGDAQASAVLSWGLNRGNLHVSNLSRDGAATSATPIGNRKLWGRNIANNSAKLAAKINKDCFSGAGTGTNIAGLDVAIGSTTNTYATIDRSNSNNAYFRPTVVDPGILTAPTFALIRDDIRKIYEACGENPDVAFCSPAVFNAVGGLFDNTRRQNDQAREVTLAGRGKIVLDAGFQAIEFDGMFFVKDKDATANTIYYCNTAHMELQYLPSAVMREMMAQDEMAGVQADDGYGQVPLGFVYEKLAKQGASERAEIVSTAQLKVDRPNAFGVRLNVAA
jgi:hypothetical protein